MGVCGGWGWGCGGGGGGGDRISVSLHNLNSPVLPVDDQVLRVHHQPSYYHITQVHGANFPQGVNQV